MSKTTVTLDREMLSKIVGNRSEFIRKAIEDKFQKDSGTSKSLPLVLEKLEFDFKISKDSYKRALDKLGFEFKQTKAEYKIAKRNLEKDINYKIMDEQNEV